MKTGKFDVNKEIPDLKEFKIKHGKLFAGVCAFLFLILIVGYFEQSEFFVIGHLFLYSTPIAYVIGLFSMFFMVFALTSRVVLTPERIVHIIFELGNIKIYDFIDLNKLSSADYSRSFNMLGMNLLRLFSTDNKKLLIPVDIYEKKDVLINSFMEHVKNEDKLEINREMFLSILDKKHSLQWKNILILLITFIILYSGIMWFVVKKPLYRLNLNIALLEVTKVFSPSNDDIYVELGALYIKKGEYKKAEVTLRKALELNPDRAKTLYYYGVTNMYLYSIDKAIDSFEKALKIKTETSYLSSLALAYSLKNDKENALKNADKAFEIGSESVQDYEYLSNVYFKYGDLRKGILCLAKIRDLEDEKRKRNPQKTPPVKEQPKNK